MVKQRIFPDSNYKALYFNNKTLRISLDTKKKMTELEFPEFYDVKITSKCQGKCPWCYMDSLEDDNEYSDLSTKITDFFGHMSENEKPFQVAIGGGEPTSHTDFISCLEQFDGLGIVPNFTTNGMFVENNPDEIMEATKKYCGGVAVSCHPHLKKYWEEAADLFHKNKVRLNFHIIISDKKSIDEFIKIYHKWKDRVDHFVLLPYSAVGRASERGIDWEYMVKHSPVDNSKLAFGANFYPYLKEGNHKFKVSLYEPEMFSKFLDMKDMKLYKSSFDEDYVK